MDECIFGNNIAQYESLEYTQRMVHQMGKPPGGIDGRGALLQLQAASGYTDSQTVGEWASFTLGGLVGQ